MGQERGDKKEHKPSQCFFKDSCYCSKCYTNLQGVSESAIITPGISEELTCHGLTFISKEVNVEGFVVIVFLILTLIKC